MCLLNLMFVGKPSSLVAFYPKSVYKEQSSLYRDRCTSLRHLFPLPPQYPLLVTSPKKWPPLTTSCTVLSSNCLEQQQCQARMIIETSHTSVAYGK